MIQPQHPEIQLLDLGNGIRVPADWVTIIPGPQPIAVLKPMATRVVVGQGAGQEPEEGDKETA